MILRACWARLSRSGIPENWCLLRCVSPVLAHSGADLMLQHVRSWRKQTKYLEQVGAAQAAGCPDVAIAWPRPPFIGEGPAWIGALRLKVGRHRAHVRVSGHVSK